MKYWLSVEKKKIADLNVSSLFIPVVRKFIFHLGDFMLLNVSEIAFLLQEGSEFPYREGLEFNFNSILLHDFLLSSQFDAITNTFNVEKYLN
jgi:hypothetical protein